MTRGIVTSTRKHVSCGHGYGTNNEVLNTWIPVLCVVMFTSVRFHSVTTSFFFWHSSLTSSRENDYLWLPFKILIILLWVLVFFLNKIYERWYMVCRSFILWLFIAAGREFSRTTYLIQCLECIQNMFFPLCMLYYSCSVCVCVYIGFGYHQLLLL